MQIRYIESLVSLCFFSATVVCYLQREYTRLGRPEFLPKLMEFGVAILGDWAFVHSCIYLVLDAIDSPNARRWRGRI
jgi:hypothetical protein